MLLSFDVVEVRIVLRVLTEQIFEIHMCGCDGLGSIEKLNHLRQVLNPKNFDSAHDGGLRCIGLGQDESFVFFLLHRHGDGQGATNGLDGTIEREFADQKIIIEESLFWISPSAARIPTAMGRS